MQPGWRKSSFSAQTECVEVAMQPDQVVVRHSKFPNEEWLTFSRAEWRAFVKGVQAGEFDG